MRFTGNLRMAAVTLITFLACGNTLFGYTINVQSTPCQGCEILALPAEAGGITNYTRSGITGSVSFTAPETCCGADFLMWTVVGDDNYYSRYLEYWIYTDLTFIAVYEEDCGDPCNLNITYPSGGEDFCAGDVLTLTWGGTSTPGCPDLIVELYNGTTLAQLFPIEENDGSCPCTLSSDLEPGDSYRFRITCYDCTDECWDWSSSFEINRIPWIDQHPTGGSICEGESHQMCVTAGGGDLNYQWQGNEGSGWGDIPGATSSCYPASVPADYRCRVYNYCAAVYSNSATLTLKSDSTAPTGASASPSSICPGESSMLTVQGGSLGTGASWMWYRDSCGGTYVDTGSSISVSPSSTTTYWVRAEGDCNTTSCATVAVNVGTLSVAPTGASASPSSVCPGECSSLTVQGGSLGTGASWMWYRESCGGTYVDTGSSISVCPSSTTTYYVRAEGDCNTTSCASVILTIDAPAVAPTDATADPNPACEGDPVTLTAIGGSGGTLTWYADSCGSADPNDQIGTGQSIEITAPGTTTTYYVRVEGPCGDSPCASVVLIIDCQEPSGACCFEATGGCLVLTEDECSMAGGNWAGAYTDCTDADEDGIADECEGACCLSDGLCLDGTGEDECIALAGIHMGLGVHCDETNCNGACCFYATGGCLVLSQDNCNVAEGTWVGPNTDCADTDENGVADACEGCPNPGDSGNYCTADIDGSGDCVVSLADLAELLGTYDKCPGDPGYNPAADLVDEGDGCITLADLAELLGQYGDDCN